MNEILKLDSEAYWKTALSKSGYMYRANKDNKEIIVAEKNDVH